MTFDPKDSKLIIIAQKKTIKKLRDGIVEIKQIQKTVSQLKSFEASP